MVQVTVELPRDLDKIVGVVKSIYGFSSKDKAIQFIIKEMGEEIFERELNPKFVRNIKKMMKGGKYSKYKSISELRKEIENA